VSNTELELINLIRGSADPSKALQTATSVIIDYLKQHESFEEQAPACPRVSA
jgi:hypothetical protein